MATTFTMSAANTEYSVPGSGVTFTLPGPRRVKVTAAARFNAATAGVYYTRAAMVAGTGPTTSGMIAAPALWRGQAYLPQTGGPGQTTVMNTLTYPLQAGTYTAFATGQSTASGGSVQQSYVLAEVVAAS